MSHSSEQRIAVGIDGGGSNTRVIAETFSGEVLFRGQSGASNLLTTDGGAIKRHLDKATAGCPAPTVVCGCFAGLLLPEHRTRAAELLAEIFPHAKVYVEPDYTAALFASQPLANVAVIAGTGSVICSFQDGHFQKSGGGGYLLGDEGSGFAVGRAGLRCFLAGDVASEDPLAMAIEAEFGTIAPVEIVSQLYTSPVPAKRLAQLSGSVGKSAELGADWARKVVQEHMDQLANLAAKHLVRYVNIHSHNRPKRIALAGGLWKASPVFSTEFKASLQTHFINFVGNSVQAQSEVLWLVDLLGRPPVTGAATLAKTYFERDSGEQERMGVN